MIPEKAAKVSVLLMDMPREEDSDTTSIDITRVNSECLGKVVDFMVHYAEEEMKEIPTPLGGSSFEEVSIPLKKRQKDKTLSNVPVVCFPFRLNPQVISNVQLSLHTPHFHNTGYGSTMVSKFCCR